MTHPSPTSPRRLRTCASTRSARSPTGEAHGGGRVREGARARRDLGVDEGRVGPPLPVAQGRIGGDRHRRMAQHGGASGHPPGRRDGSGVRGRLSTYAPRSRYQLIVDSMAVAGVGALLALLEERRANSPPRGCSTTRANAHPLPARQRGRRDLAIGRRAPRCAAADRRPLSAPVYVWPARVQGKERRRRSPAPFPVSTAWMRTPPCRAGRSDRRPRRRQHRGLVGVQRGRGRARRRGERNPLISGVGTKPIRP